MFSRKALLILAPVALNAYAMPMQSKSSGYFVRFSLLLTLPF